MENSNDIEARLTGLEIKATFTEDLLDQLDQVIVRQQQQIDSLIREIARLPQPSTDGGGGAPRHRCCGGHMVNTRGLRQR